MSDMIFRSAAQAGRGLVDHFQRYYGVAVNVAGNDLVVASRDARRLAPANILTLHPRLALERGREDIIIPELIRQIPEFSRNFNPDFSGTTIEISEGFGLIDQTNQHRNRLAVTTHAELFSHLKEQTLPLLMEKFDAKYVTGITIDAEKLQKYVSLAKILMLADHYHDVARVEDLVMNQRVLDNILPDAIEPLKYLDTLTRCSPMAMTLPIHRLECAWHFQSDAMWRFHHAAANGVIQEFMLSIYPLADLPGISGWSGLRRMSEKNIWRFLRSSVKGLNQLLGYICDFRNFADDQGVVNCLKMVQAFSAIQLIFADMAAFNFTNEAHNRINYSMVLLDKLANLRVQLGQAYGVPTHRNEAQAMIELCSISQRDELKVLLNDEFGRNTDSELTDTFSEMVDKCYDQLHQHLGQTASTEADRLDHLRSQRNIRHGAFLGRDQFGKLFFESTGTIPSTIATIPYLLTLGLMFNPKRFLEFRPTV